MGETDPPALPPVSVAAKCPHPSPLRPWLTEFPPLCLVSPQLFQFVWVWVSLGSPSGRTRRGPLPAAGGAVAAARPRAGPSAAQRAARRGWACGPRGRAPLVAGEGPRETPPGPRRDAKAMAQPPPVSGVTCADAQARGGSSRSGLAGGRSGVPAGSRWRPGVALGVGCAVWPWTEPAAATLGARPWPNT